MSSDASRDLHAAVRRSRSEVVAGRFIPYAVHLNPGLVKLRQNGDLCATWVLHGQPFETASVEEIAQAKSQLVNFLHSVRGTELGEPTALWVHRVRRRFSDRLEGTFQSGFAAELDRKYWEGLAQTQMRLNELYLSVLLRPSHTASGAFKRMRTRTPEALAEFDRSSCARMEVLCGQVDASIAKFGARRLLCETRANRSGSGSYTVSPMLSFFNFLLSGVWEDVPVQQGRISDYLCSARLFAGESNGIVQMNVDGQKRMVGYLDLHDFPEVTEPGLNNCLFGLDDEFVETQSFSFRSKRESLDDLELVRKRLHSSGEGSEEQIADLGNAIEDVRNGRIFLGEYHYTLGVHGDSVGEVQAAMARARSSLSEDAGYKVGTVDVVPDGAHFAQLPGNWAWRPRTARISTRNFASLAPMHNFDHGKRSGNPWGDAITMLATPNAQPYYFNWHESPLTEDSIDKKLPGNTFICGMTGAGKSALMGFLLAQTTKVPGLRVVFFDKDRGAEILLRALGGKYKQLRRGQPTGWNPFQWAPTERTVAFVKSLILDCARRGRDEVLAVAVENECITAVERVFALPNKADRRISAILQFVGEDSELGQRLGKWCRTPRKLGSNAWVFDNAEDSTTFEGASLFGFDYTDFLQDQECGPPIVAYVLEAADTLLNGQPYMYVMEEFAKIVSAGSQTLVEFARDKQTTIRKLNGFGVFVTQSPSQVVQYPIGATLREQCVTQIFLPNTGADRADYVDGFKCTDPEFERIRSLDKDSRMFLVKQGGRSAVCRLDLGGMRDELEVISGTMDNVVLLDELRAELGTDDPSVWMDPFLRKLRARRSK